MQLCIPPLLNMRKKKITCTSCPLLLLQYFSCFPVVSDLLKPVRYILSDIVCLCVQPACLHMQSHLQAPFFIFTALLFLTFHFNLLSPCNPRAYYFFRVIFKIRMKNGGIRQDQEAQFSRENIQTNLLKYPAHNSVPANIVKACILIEKTQTSKSTQYNQNGNPWACLNMLTHK